MANVGTLGKHFIVEMWACNKEKINDPDKIMDILHSAAIAAGATVVKSFFHQFSPFGVTGVAILAESHISIHTWPKEGYVAADIFTCGDSTDPAVGVERLIEEFEPESSSFMELNRGNMQHKEALLV